jgi:predicted  nucleic acid-binding Zn-ribbon protein
MYSQTAIKKIIDENKNQAIRITLSDEQIAWVKDKLAQAENLINQAQAKFAENDSRLAALETKATQFQSALQNLSNRVTALENK